MSNTRIDRRHVLKGATLSTVAAMVAVPAVAGTAADAALMNAEAEITRLYAQLHTQPDTDSARDPFYQRIYALEDFIIETPAATLAGAAVKLRRVLDADTGIDAGAGEHETASLVGVLALVHSIVGLPTHPTRPTTSGEDVAVELAEFKRLRAAQHRGEDEDA